MGRRIWSAFPGASTGSHVVRWFLLVLIAVAAGGCGKPQGLPPKGPSNVTVITTSAHDTPVFLEFVAQTQSSRQVNIQARVNGSSTGAYILKAAW